jgi:fibronectin type III domain protein
VTFDVSAADYVASAGDPLNRINLNLPSINAPTMPGEISTERTLRNVSGATVKYNVTTTAPPGASIDVKPDTVEVPAGGSQKLKITISAAGLANGQYFGQITLADDPTARGGIESGPEVVLPVAFNKQQGIVSLTHSCSPTTFPSNTLTSCVARASNFAAQPASVVLKVTPSQGLRLSNIGGTPGVTGNMFGARWSGTLSPSIAPQIASIVSDPGIAGGYLPLSLFGIPPVAGMGDETAVNFNVPAFKYGSETYTRLGIVSNGYVVVGGTSGSADIAFDPVDLPNTARPNNMLAPYWTDLNPASGGAIRIGTLTDGADTWIIVDFEAVRLFGSATTTTFQMWIGVNGDAHPVEDITYSYGANTGTGTPEGLTRGAENRDGTSGKMIVPPPANPTPSGSSFRVNTTPPTAGGTAEITYKASAQFGGVYTSLASLTSNLTPGVTQVPVTLTVTGPGPGR